MYDFTRQAPRVAKGSSKWDLMLENREHLAEEGIVPFSVADMEFITAPEIREGLKEFIDKEILGYTDIWEDYKESVLKFFKNRHHWEIEKDWIVTTPGVVSAIYSAIEAFTTEDQGVVLLSPVYYPFQRAIKDTGRLEVRVPLLEEKGVYTIDFPGLEEALSKEENTCLIFCNPHNPIGRVWRREELEKVLSLCRKYGITLISDEIWWDFVMPGYRHTSMGTMITPEDRAVICTAASKSFNLAGLYTSNIILPNEEMRKEYLEILATRFRGLVGILGYVSTKVAYDRATPWLDELIEVLDENRRYLEDFFKENFPELTFSRMEGTYLFWVNFGSWGLTPEELEKFMTEKALLFLDEGYVFGEEGNGWERFNIACPKEILVEAMERLKKAAKAEGFVKEW